MSAVNSGFRSSGECLCDSWDCQHAHPYRKPKYIESPAKAFVRGWNACMEGKSRLYREPPVAQKEQE